MSDLPLVVDRHDGEDPGRRQLLALRGVRRGMEQHAAVDAAACTARLALILAPQV